MDSIRSRAATLIGLAAAAGAFGIATSMSLATAPTARADDFTDVINSVDGDFTAAQTAFTAADTDFAGGQVQLGLEQFFAGVDHDFLAAPNNLLIGTLELLANDSVTPSLLGYPAEEFSFASGLADAESALGLAQSYSSDAATALFSGDYVIAAIDNYDASQIGADALQELFEGVVASF